MQRSYTRESISHQAVMDEFVTVLEGLGDRLEQR
jgi:hypothetical protein